MKLENKKKKEKNLVEIEFEQLWSESSIINHRSNNSNEANNSRRAIDWRDRSETCRTTSIERGYSILAPTPSLRSIASAETTVVSAYRMLARV